MAEASVCEDRTGHEHTPPRRHKFRVPIELGSSSQAKIFGATATSTPTPFTQEMHSASETLVPRIQRYQGDGTYTALR
jgi:hypothetical protein